LTSGSQGHTNHPADARVRGRNRHLQIRRQYQPNTRRSQDAQATVHHQCRIVLEALVIRDTLTDSLGHVRSHKQRTGELAHRREQDRQLDRHRAGADGGRKRVRDIVRADAKRGAKAEQGAEDDNCC